MLAIETMKALKEIVGEKRLLTRPEEMLSYSYDAFIEEAMPECVLFPVTTEEVSKVLTIASRQKIPVTARGAGTSVCGAAIPARGGIVMCLSKMDQILTVSCADRYVIVQPGVINGDVQKRLAPEGFFYPPDPGSIGISTIGGNVAQNAGGPRCLKYGVTSDYILGMEVVLASGKVIRFGSRNVKDVTGYRFSGLFCGSEGTLGIITEVTLRVAPQPESARTLLVTFDELDQTAKAVADIIGAGIIPAAMELMDRVIINAIEDSAKLGLDRGAAGTLLIEIDGNRETLEKEMAQITAKVKANGATSVKTASSESERAELWTARRSAYGVFAKLAPDVISEDVTVPVSSVPKMIERIGEIMRSHGLTGGVLAHAGDGNMHPMIAADRSDGEEWARVERANAAIFKAAAELHGTLSGEHGIGLAKAEYLSLVMDDDSIAFMKEIKRTLDPAGILNPGKFV